MGEASMVQCLVQGQSSEFLYLVRLTHATQPVFYPLSHPDPTKVLEKCNSWCGHCHVNAKCPFHRSPTAYLRGMYRCPRRTCKNVISTIHQAWPGKRGTGEDRTHLFIYPRDCNNVAVSCFWSKRPITANCLSQFYSRALHKTVTLTMSYGQFAAAPPVSSVSFFHSPWNEYSSPPLSSMSITCCGRITFSWWQFKTWRWHVFVFHLLQGRQFSRNNRVVASACCHNVPPCKVINYKRRRKNEFAEVHQLSYTCYNNQNLRSGTLICRVSQSTGLR